MNVVECSGKVSIDDPQWVFGSKSHNNIIRKLYTQEEATLREPKGAKGSLKVGTGTCKLVGSWGPGEVDGLQLMVYSKL